MAGGTRYTRCSKTSTKQELIAEAAGLFKVDSNEYQLDMSCDVKGECLLSQEDTVEKIFQEMKLKTIRFYLLCKPTAAMDVTGVSGESHLTDGCQNPSVFAELPDIPDIIDLLDDDVAVSRAVTEVVNPSRVSAPCPQHRADQREQSTDLTPNPLVEALRVSGIPIPQLEIPPQSESTDPSASVAPVESELYNNLGTPTIFARCNNKPANLIDALFHLACKAEEDETDKCNIVNVTRPDVLDGGMRAFSRSSFQPTNKLSVRFVGEDGIDNGGPTRDFLRLALTEIESKFFCGPDKGKYLRLNAAGRLPLLLKSTSQSLPP